jgi:hypothetical protein
MPDVQAKMAANPDPVGCLEEATKLADIGAKASALFLFCEVCEVPLHCDLAGCVQVAALLLLLLFVLVPLLLLPLLSLSSVLIF